MGTASRYDKYDYERRGGHGSAASERKAFEVDKGRIIHSGAFRRLQGKTQVLGVGERDFYRTRLTHSIEVGQLARGLCSEIVRENDFEPDQDLVEAICLAHDLGHPPFGHSGEDFLHKRLKEKSGGFGANPQNLRIVALLEAKYGGSGLDFTRATLDGLVKYPNLYNKKHDTGSKFTYVDDSKLLAWIKDGIKKPESTPIETQLADWADQMAYCVNDIEDVMRAGLLSLVEMKTRAKEISERATPKIGKAVPDITAPSSIEALADDLEERYAKPSDLRERKMNLKAWTSSTIKRLKDSCKIVFLRNSERSVRYQYALRIADEGKALAEVLKATAYLLVFADPRVRTLEAKGNYIIGKLFDKFSEDITLLPRDFQQMIESKKFGSKERLVADFIAGMTDSYAYEYYGRLFHPGSGSFYENV